MSNSGSLMRIDCYPLGGVAGDMFAAAMFDAFPHLYESFTADLLQLDVEGLQVKLTSKTSHSLTAQHFSVTQNTDVKPPRTLPAVGDFLNSKSLDAEVISTTIGIYRLLAEAEAAVHGKTIDTVHFHEVSDWDSMVDILAAAGIISRLRCQHWRLGPLPLGGGTINTAHGNIPLPAPATLHLANGLDWIDDGQPGERVTPTGAAILAFLTPLKLHSQSVAASLETVGVGCGTKDLADRANIFRVSVFSCAEGSQHQTDLVSHLAFEIDDMTGEEIALAADILRDQPGVLDVSTVAMYGKKNRPGTGFRLLVKPQASSEIVGQCFLQTSTLGVRYSEVQRKILCRRQETIDGNPLKIVARPGGVSTAKIESDTLSAIDTLYKRREHALTVQRKATDE